MKRQFRRIATLAPIFALMVIFNLLAVTLITTGKSAKVQAQSSSFQVGHIIDDNIFTNDNSLTAAQIQTFLNDMVGSCDTNGAQSITYHYNASTEQVNNSSDQLVTTSRATYGQRYDNANNTNVAGAPYVCINNYVENPSTLQSNLQNPSASISGGESAAQIIYNAAQQYQINPEVILTTLQKEQGLVTDKWPWLNEYQHAMGYACPDSGGCSSSYDDFYQQIDGAAWQFRYYLNNPGEFNYWIGNNTIKYAPGCSGSTVDIQNAATAALYIYTPYQPNSNVLASTNSIGSSSGPGPAISDSCAAYGNRNFWWYFNSWFGPSVDTNISLGEESGTYTIYVLYDGLKEGIPSPDVLNAWGLNGLPVTSLDPSVFNAIPTANTVLTRYAVNEATGQNYFADNGNVFSVSSNDASIWGEFPGAGGAQISSTLVNFANFEGEIKPYVYVSGNPTYYVVDNGSLHAVASGQAYTLWAGQNNNPMQLSSAYFNAMTQVSVISNPEFSYNNTAYILSDGEQFSLSSNIAALLPSNWSPTSIGQGLYSTFYGGGALQYMIQANNSPTVYLLDAGKERGIPDSQTYYAFQVGSGSDITTVSSDLVNFIPVGSIIGSNIAIIDGQSYVIDHGLGPIPSNLSSAYNPNSTAISLSNTYQSILASSGPTASALVKSGSSPAVYFLDNGNKLPFTNPTALSTIAGNTPITNLTAGALSAFPTGSIMQDYITNGSTNYLVNSGNAYVVSSNAVASAWSLGSPLTLSSTSVSNFPVIGTLSQNVQAPDGDFCLVDSGALHCAATSTMVMLWNLTNGLIHPTQVLLNNQNIQYGGYLTRFVIGQPGSTSANTIYTVSNGSLFGIPTMNEAINLGISGSQIQLSQATINSLSAGLWQGYLATDDSGNLWVLDGGVKQQVPSSLTSAWESGITPTALGSTYLSTLPTGLNISNSVRTANNPTIYGLKNGEIYGIPSAQAYSSSGLEPYSTVSPSLIASIPSGGIWSN